MENYIIESLGLSSTATSGLSLIAGIVVLISIWGIFSKTDRSGWNALIPILRWYGLAEIGCENALFWTFLLISPVICIPFAFIFAANRTGVGLLMIMLIITCIACLVSECVIMFKLGKAFHQSTIFSILLIIFPVICLPILAFGSASIYDEPRRGRGIYDR